MGLVTVPEREPCAKVGFQFRHSLNSFDQLSVHGLLVIFPDLRQVLGCLKDTDRFLLSNALQGCTKENELQTPGSDTLSPLPGSVHPAVILKSVFPHNQLNHLVTTRQKIYLIYLSIFFICNRQHLQIQVGVPIIFEQNCYF
jgi:hypothetical protein